MNSGRRYLASWSLADIAVTPHVPNSREAERRSRAGRTFMKVYNVALYSSWRRNETVGLDFGRSGFNLNRRSANADLGISQY
jgi:hypothetical protein